MVWITMKSNQQSYQTAGFLKSVLDLLWLLLCLCALQQEPAGWGGWFEVPQAAREQDPTAPGAAAPPASQQHGQSTAAVSQADADAAAEEQQQQQGKQAGSGSDDSAAPTGRDNATDVDDEQQSEEGQLEQQQEEEEEDEVDEDELMRQLGLQLEQQLQEVERQGLPADVLARQVLARGLHLLLLKRSGSHVRFLLKVLWAWPKPCNSYKRCWCSCATAVWAVSLGLITV
jgi:hypothetical protein